MTDPREPLGNAAAELTALLDAVKTRAKKALGDQPLQADWGKQAEAVATTAAAAAATGLAGIATAAQTVGSVLDGWVQTHRSDVTDSTDGTATADTADAALAADAPTDLTSDAPDSDEPDSDAPKHDEGVAWD